MRPQGDHLVIFDLLRTYHELGLYSFKIVLNKDMFKNGESVRVNMFDPDSDAMDLDVQKWGRKINCSFRIDENISDGVCIVKIEMISDSGEELTKVFDFWVIK